MILAAASCPQPPLLLPGATGAPVAEVEELRRNCLDELAVLLGHDPEVVLIVGGQQRAGGQQSGVSSELEPSREPLSIRVGRALLGEAGCTLPAEAVIVPSDAPAEQCLELGAALALDPRRCAMLIMADGSARRGLKAPGYLDERAHPFDAAIEAALRAPDPAALAAVEPELAAELLVAGRAAWQVLAGAVRGRAVRSSVRYSDDPFGVWYPVVGWALD